MQTINYKEEVINQLKRYSADHIVFTKKDIDEQLKVRRLTKDEIIHNIINPKNLIFAQKQEREFRGQKETRFNCYFLFSRSRAHRYVLKFEDKLKVITAIPIGRKTLNKTNIEKILGGVK